MLPDLTDSDSQNVVYNELKLCNDLTPVSYKIRDQQSPTLY